MTPFELQADLTRQWLGLISSAMVSATDAFVAAGQQSLRFWGEIGRTGSALPGVTMPMPQWPTSLYQADLFRAPMPLAATFPWSSWPTFAGTWPMLHAAPAFHSPVWTPGMFPAASWGWLTPWAVPASSFWGPMPGWRIGPPSAADMMEQAATAYRTASGHAVATVLGPLAAPLDTRSYGVPWWQTPRRH